MKIYHGFNDKHLKLIPRGVAVGIFDGVHRGHRKILRRMLREAEEQKILSMVVTFNPHPDKILHPKKNNPILMSLEHRLEFFKKMGLAEVLVISFNKAFSKISREDFLRKLLRKRLGMRVLSVGHDFRFGRQGLGDAAYLAQQAKVLGFHLSVASPLKTRGEIISSTRIRRLIENGRLNEASKMLGRPVSVYGTVVRGHGRGRGLGFPTANLNPHHETLPPHGVYAVWGFLNGRKLKGILHIGQKPTFHDPALSVEVHFLGFRQNIYDREIELFFVSKLRNTKHFKNPDALAKAIQKDAAQARRVFGGL